MSNYVSLSYSEIINLAIKLRHFIDRDYKYLQIYGLPESEISDFTITVNELSSLPADNDLIKSLIDNSQTCLRNANTIKDYLLQMVEIGCIKGKLSTEINERYLQVLNNRELCNLIYNFKSIDFQNEIIFYPQFEYLLNAVNSIHHEFAENINNLENSSVLHKQVSTLRKQLFEKMVAQMQNISQLGVNLWNETNKEYAQDYQTILAPAATSKTVSKVIVAA